MALTEDRIEYRVIIDHDPMHDGSTMKSTRESADLYASWMRSFGHYAEVMSRHVVTQYTDWE